MAFTLRTPAFAWGDLIPRRHTCDGENVSPALEWEGAPLSTKSFALIVDDPDAPAGAWNHWLLWDIPASTRSLSEGFVAGSLGVSGVNDFGKPGYGGPCPPRGHGPHRYFFTLVAMNAPSLGLAAGSARPALRRAMQGRTIEETNVLGRYERK